jgi:hypothetical protein
VNGDPRSGLGAAGTKHHLTGYLHEHPFAGTCPMPMKLVAIAIIPLLLLVACGTTEEKTVVVTPQPGQTVVVTPSH